MRISVLGLIVGISCTAALAVPLLPSHMLGDFWHMRASYGVSEIVDASSRSLSGLLNISAQADEVEAQAIDFDKLVKFDDREFSVTFDDSVSTTVLSQNKVRLIGYGHSRNINIVRTPTGTYSTAGLVSPNVQYPGISVVEKTVLQAQNTRYGISWLQFGGWFPMSVKGGNSVITYGNTQGGGSFAVSGSQMCSRGPGFAYCN